MALQYVAFLLRLSKCLIGDVFMTFPSMQMDNSSFHSVSQSTSNNFVRNLTCGHQRWLTECHKNQFLRCAAIAQWIHLRLPYCHPGSSPMHIIYILIWATFVLRKEQKQTKSGRVWAFFKKNEFLNITLKLFVKFPAYLFKFPICLFKKNSHLITSAHLNCQLQINLCLSIINHENSDFGIIVRLSSWIVIYH